MRSRSERTFDLLLALSIASWAVMGGYAAGEHAPPMRLTIGALHLTVAYVVLGRARLRRAGSPVAIARSLPAVLVAGVALRLAAPLGGWPPAVRGLFVAGAGMAIASFLFLGRNFAVLPALRGVTRSGPYRWVRHPAYAGEILMVAACALSSPGPSALALVVVALALVALRIDAEERLLMGAAEYREYAGAVRFRLLPGLW